MKYYYLYSRYWLRGNYDVETAARRFIMNCAAAQPRSLEGKLLSRRAVSKQ